MMSKIEMYRIFMLEHNVIIDPAYNKPYIFSDKKNNGEKKSVILLLMPFYKRRILRVL